MDIDACLGIVPTAAAAVHKPTGLRTTIIGILGIEDIVNLAQEADSRPLAIGYWQQVLEIEIRGGIRTEHGILVLGIVQILLAYHIRLHGSCKARYIKSEE